METLGATRISIVVIGLFLVIITSASLLTFKTCRANPEMDDAADQVESSARQLLKDIFGKRYKNILSIIPEHGLQGASGRITKKYIEKEIFNNSSYLYKRMYRTPSHEELKQCKETRSMPVSPYYFYIENHGRYDVKVTKLDDKINLYRVGFYQEKRKKECRLVLFSANFIFTENKVFLYSYFFNF